MAQATIWNPNTAEKRVVTVGNPIPTGFQLWTGGTATGEQAQQAIFRGTTQPTEPTIKRDGADLLVKTATTGRTDLAGWTSGVNLVEAARSIIQMKQGFNKDIQSAKQYWQTRAKDISSFEGADKIFTGMSPVEQANIRAGRYATAEAHIKGLTEEQEYRRVRTEDTLKYVADIYSEKVRELEVQKKDANERERIAISKRLADLQEARDRLTERKFEVEQGIGDPTTYFGTENSADYKRIGFKQDGSLSWRHNNPGNIKFGDFAQGYGATQGQVATDGGNFAIFPDEIVGKQAMADLLQGSGYKNLTLDAAMKRWSNNGYGAEVWNKDYRTSKMNTIVGPLLDELIEAMIKREGWSVGKDLKPDVTSKMELSEAKKTSLMAEAGLTNADVKDYTADDWILLDGITRESSIILATEVLNVGDGVNPALKKQLIIRGKVMENPSPDLVYSELQLRFKILSQAELNAIMQQSGYTLSTGLFGSKWIASKE